MKKLLVFLMTIVLLFSFTACGDEASDKTTSSEDEVTENTDDVSLSVDTNKNPDTVGTVGGASSFITPFYDESLYTEDDFDAKNHPNGYHSTITYYKLTGKEPTDYAFPTTITIGGVNYNVGNVKVSTLEAAGWTMDDVPSLKLRKDYFHQTVIRSGENRMYILAQNVNDVMTDVSDCNIYKFSISNNTGNEYYSNITFDYEGITYDTTHTDVIKKFGLPDSIAYTDVRNGGGEFVSRTISLCYGFENHNGVNVTFDFSDNQKTCTMKGVTLSVDIK